MKKVSNDREREGEKETQNEKERDQKYLENHLSLFFTFRFCSNAYHEIESVLYKMNTLGSTFRFNLFNFLFVVRFYLSVLLKSHTNKKT